MDTQQYLSRIKFAGKSDPNIKVLAALQEAHLLSVPFENLDIHRGKEIALDLPHVYQKVVTMMRGGFCYELNSLFHWLLQKLGFKVKLVSGRVYDRHRNDFGPEFDHMLILADVAGNQWIVDVGYGEFSMHPLPFVLIHPYNDTNGRFLIEKDIEQYFRISRFSEKENRYIPEYRFSEQERHLGDFSGMCTYHQTSPQSHFTQQRVCSIATRTGRITLTDDKLIVTENGVRKESPVGKGEVDHILKEYFHIVL